MSSSSFSSDMSVFTVLSSMVDSCVSRDFILPDCLLLSETSSSSDVAGTKSGSPDLCFSVFFFFLLFELRTASSPSHSLLGMFLGDRRLGDIFFLRLVCLPGHSGCDFCPVSSLFFKSSTPTCSFARFSVL